VYVTRGELERALALYQESLQLWEQIGDLQGKAATLSEMSNVYWQQNDYNRAAQLVEQSIVLQRQVGHLEGAAIDTIKLGQLAEVRGDRETALTSYREGLSILERMDESRTAAQVRQLIARLEGEKAQPADPVRQLSAQARSSAQAGRAEEAVAAQEQAVALARAQAAEQEAGSEGQVDALVALSVLLYNLAGYYQATERHDEAVAALQEVVALDERTGHPDLASDREALEEARALARLSPEERASLQAGSAAPPDVAAQIEAQLAQLSPEERAEMEAAAHEVAQRLAQMSPEEQAAELAGMQAAAVRQEIERLALEARDAAIAAERGERERAPLIAQIDEVAVQAAEGEPPGSPWADLAAYLRALVALLRGQALPPVPAQYAGHVAAVRAARDDKPERI
jgi:tetratricopeptide (TPR) repeat protein